MLSKDLESASATVTAIQRQARDLHERYLEAAAKTAEDIKPKSLWERTEPVRTVLEAVLAPFDMVFADHWISALEKAAGQPAEWVGGGQAHPLQHKHGRVDHGLPRCGCACVRSGDRHRSPP